MLNKFLYSLFSDNIRTLTLRSIFDYVTLYITRNRVIDRTLVWTFGFHNYRNHIFFLPKSCSCCILPANSLSKYLAANLAPYTSLVNERTSFLKAAFSDCNWATSALYWAGSRVVELNFNCSDSFVDPKSIKINY